MKRTSVLAKLSCAIVDSVIIAAIKALSRPTAEVGYSRAAATQNASPKAPVMMELAAKL
jgi:hypothetical protein